MSIVGNRPLPLYEAQKLVQDGWVKPHVDRTFPLDETAEAISYMARGEVKGKIAISI